MTKKEIKYKSFGNEFRQMLAQDIEENMAKFNDPLVLGELVHLLLQERENTNRLFKTLIEKIDRLEADLGTKKEELLPDVDQKIVDFVTQHKHVTAKDVKKEFRYKGTNAASARLNKLYNKGILRKKQVGRKVVYMV